MSDLWIRKDDADRRDTERRAFIADLESLLQEANNKCERLEKEVAANAGAKRPEASNV